MKRSRKITIIALLVATVLTVCVSADNEYSSQTDPLVSLSYVNDILAPEIMEKVMERIESQYIKIDDVHSVADTTYNSITLSKNQKVMAKSCCEIIIISGNVKSLITSTSANASINDLTSGSVIRESNIDLANGHYLVIAAADGRGISVASDNATILIRGEYNIAG